MRRALYTPLLSLFMPGLGQLFNRQVGKGALMVMVTTVLFLVTLGLFFYHFNQALAYLTQNPPAGDQIAALRQRLLSQGTGWLLAAGLVYLGLVGFAVLDAWRTGRRLDRGEGKVS